MCLPSSELSDQDAGWTSRLHLQNSLGDLVDLASPGLSKSGLTVLAQIPFLAALTYIKHEIIRDQTAVALLMPSSTLLFIQSH